VVVRLDDLDALSSADDLAAADGHGQLGALARLRLELLFEGGALSAAGSVRPDWLIRWNWDICDCIQQDCAP
jgi:hypothetical protein